MKEKRTKSRREWVKNALIIFLSVMLVLTFFSNTIMNYSLPEVAAQYPSSTTITTKIRGSGVVEAAQSYHVIIEETRTVASVEVKAGDTIAAGQVLLVLDETESLELQEARSTYEALKLEYDKSLIDVGQQNNASEASMEQLRTAVTQAQTDLNNAKKYEEDLAWYQSQVNSAQSTLDSKQAALTSANGTVEALQSQISNAENSNADYLSAKKRAESGDAEAAAEAQQIYEQEIAPTIASLTGQLTAAQQTAADAAQAVTTAQSTLTGAQNALSQFQSGSGSMSVDSAQAALTAAQSALSSAEAAAEDQAIQEAYDDAVEQLDQADLERRLGEAEEAVKKLEENAAAAEIISRYAGVVTEVNVAAGDTTSGDMELMVVEMTEKGYTLTATVTKTQARTLREGLEAEVTNLWDSGITMTLTSIAADKNDPANSRTLTFSVQGEDVTVGQSLSFSVGDKNAAYDVVLPTSAIHSDADGSFVYTVAVKSSPLGNRYTVKKKTVTVLASDDVNSAVSGELSTADFVITTSTVPLEVGDQVRIAE